MLGLAGAESVLGLVLAAACLAWVSFLCWRQARPPRCAGCRTLMISEASRVINDSPPVIETVYRCPRCGRIFEERVVGAWE